ncbi:MAG: dihydroneopterin aldolase [Armatimonadetes bacterium]|nr:dihydroneopterin aldolase [Armatimonadota bacterium]
MYKVLVEGLEFYAFHGVSDEEQKVGTRYRLDIEASIEGRVPESDRVKDTVDYGWLAREAIQTATGEKWRTVEKVAHDIAAKILSDEPRISEIRVRLLKVPPPIPFTVSAAGVECVLIRERN